MHNCWGSEKDPENFLTHEMKINCVYLSPKYTRQYPGKLGEHVGTEESGFRSSVSSFLLRFGYPMSLKAPCWRLAVGSYQKLGPSRRSLGHSRQVFKQTVEPWHPLLPVWFTYWAWDEQLCLPGTPAMMCCLVRGPTDHGLWSFKAMNFLFSSLLSQLFCDSDGRLTNPLYPSSPWPTFHLCLCWWGPSRILFFLLVSKVQVEIGVIFLLWGAPTRLCGCGQNSEQLNSIQLWLQVVVFCL